MQECSRLESLNDLLTQSGVDKDVYGDFVDPTFELLQELARIVQAGDMNKAERRLLEAFNEGEVGNAVIMHFRVCFSPSPIQSHVHVFFDLSIAFFFLRKRRS